MRRRQTQKTRRTTALPNVTVERYKTGRHWAVREEGRLLAVTVYKKGAEAVRNRLYVRPMAKWRTRQCRR